MDLVIQLFHTRGHLPCSIGHESDPWKPPGGYSQIPLPLVQIPIFYNPAIKKEVLVVVTVRLRHY
jgi:hypothetical protein